MENILEYRGVGKSFPGVRALDDISFVARGGEVTALLGENGAGKSTALKILSGDLRQDEGELLLDGESLRFSEPREALNAGISVIYQERQLIPMMSVMENLFIETLPKTPLGLVDKKKLRQDTKAIIDKFGLPIDPDEPVGRLNVAYQQMVEIMKAYRRNAKVIAFDEPTAPLTDKEIEILFSIIEELKAAGKVIIYVSHRLSEVTRLADKVVIFKDGRLVTELQNARGQTDAEVAEFSRKMVHLMVGRDVGDTYENLSRNEDIGEPLLEVKNLTTPYIKNVSLTVHRGEVVGLAGLVGAGRTEVARAIFGADPITGGEITLNGEPAAFKSPKEAIKRGVAFCPEDRKEQGMVLGRSITDNVIMSVIDRLVKGGIFVDRAACEELSVDAINRFSIRTPSADKITGELSGGNQQKVILGRWINPKNETKLLILDEPTKGVDVGAKAEIYQMVCDLAKSGIGVIFISSELTEVVNLADQVVVMRNGTVTGTLPRAEATEKAVLELAMLD